MPAERSVPLPSSDRLLDDATTLLAALRMGFTPPETPIPPQVVVEFLRAAGILDDHNQPRPEQVKAFLEATRQEALQQLSHAWLESEDFNELQQVPALVCEGEWKNVPRATRRRLLDLGITPGEELAIVQTVPLGDPLVVIVRGMRLALRRREAAWIRVQ